jgi:cell division protein FtsB
MSSPALQPRIRVPRIAQDAVDRARLTVVPRVRSRAPRVPFVTLVSMLLVGGIVGLLLFNTSLQQASFSAASLERQADALAAREQTLRMELDELRDPQRVATQAQQLGMVIAPAPVFLDLDSGKVSGVRIPATRANALRLHPKAPTKPAVLAPAPTVVEVPSTPEAGDQLTQSAEEAGRRKNRNSGRR